MSQLGGVIAKLRRSRGLTQGQLGEYARISASHINRIESGVRPNPSIETIAKIAKVLDVSVDYLLTEAGLLPASDNSQLTPEVAHLNSIIQAFPEGPLKAQAQEIVIQIATALMHTLDQHKLDKIMAGKETQEENKE